MAETKARVTKDRAEADLVEFIVHIPFKASIEYEVKVKRDTPKKMYEQAMALISNKSFDPTDWAADPNFYEAFGSGWRESIEEIEESDCGIIQDDVLVWLAELESDDQ